MRYLLQISTHSLTRRLTQLTVILAEYQQNFNSQPHKEADAFLLPEIEGCDYFNSQPHKEADVVSVCVSVSTSISTHSLTRRLT